MKKISTTTVKNLVKGYRKASSEGIVVPVQIGDSSFDVHVKTRLTMAECDAFVNRVVNASFDEFGHYHHQWQNSVERITFLQMFTDLPALTMSGDKSDDDKPMMDVEAMEDLYYALNCDEIIRTNDTLWNLMCELEASIRIETEYKHDLIKEYSSTSGEVRDLVHSLREFVEKAGQIVDGIDLSELVKYAGDLAGATEGLDKQEVVDRVIDLAKVKEEKEK